MQIPKERPAVRHPLSIPGLLPTRLQRQCALGIGTVCSMAVTHAHISAAAGASCPVPPFSSTSDANHTDTSVVL